MGVEGFEAGVLVGVGVSIGSTVEVAFSLLSDALSVIFENVSEPVF